MKILKTNIYRMPSDLVVDVTNKDDVLVWVPQARLWDHSHRPAPDLDDAVELDCEDLVRERISKITKMTEIEGPKMYAITERGPNGELGILVEANNLMAYSPSLKTWIRPSMAVASVLDASVVSAEEAERLVKEGKTHDPHRPKVA